MFRQPFHRDLLSDLYSCFQDVLETSKGNKVAVGCKVMILHLQQET